MSVSTSLLKQLAEKHCGEVCLQIEKIPQSGSSRLYYRLLFKDKPSIIGVYNADVKENKAFFYFTELFLSQNINVPSILHIHEDSQHYLLNDLGDETLYSFLVKHREKDTLGSKVLDYYYDVVKILPRIQITADKIDFSISYPRAAFDRQSMQWDLNYFKYYFLKLANIQFDEQLLENDFNKFIDFLLEADDQYFLYRDFQSRNIMIKGDDVFFIDYQGGRRGALQYDVASLLYDGKADIQPADRDRLLQVYLDELSTIIPLNKDKFLKYYDGFVLIRILQALGTYGYRGYYERKSHFLQSIPYAIRNIRYWLDKVALPIEIPEMKRVLQEMVNSDFLPNIESDKEKLTVSVNSFSYKKGIPQDLSANGGGFVFDCRALPNPGREEQYRELNGKDFPVIEYLEDYEETDFFKKHVFALVNASVENYLERKFTNLMVNFGCTGGQHRSVYFAEEMAKYLQKKYPQIKVKLQHTNQ